MIRQVYISHIIFFVASVRCLGNWRGAVHASSKIHHLIASKCNFRLVLGKLNISLSHIVARIAFLHPCQMSHRMTIDGLLLSPMHNLT